MGSRGWIAGGRGLLRWSVAALLGASLAACGGSSEGPQTLATETIDVTFPVAYAAYESPSVTVKGRIDHDEAGAFSVMAIAGGSEIDGDVNENGDFVIPAVPVSGDGARASITLIARHPGAGIAETVIRLTRGPTVGLLRGLATDPADGRHLSIDTANNALVSLDAVTGALATVSGPNRGQGPLLYGPSLFVIDMAGRTAYVVDRSPAGPDSIICVDLAANSQRTGQSHISEDVRLIRLRVGSRLAYCSTHAQSQETSGVRVGHALLPHQQSSVAREWSSSNVDSNFG